MDRWAHQSKAVADVLAAFARGVRRVIVTGPTGSGKTTIAADLTRDFWDRDKAVSILTQRKLMVEQLERVFRSHGLTPGIRAAGHPRSFQARVQISSVQTEWSRVFKSGEWPMHPADLAIIDEAHLHDNEQGRAFCDRVLAGGGVILGLTATPVALDGMYDELIVAGTPSELHACGALVQAIHYGPDEPDLRKHKKLQALLARGGKVSEPENVKLLGPKVPGLFGRVYGWFKKLNPEKRPTILFGPDVGGSLWFAEKFWENGVGAAHVDGQTAWMNGKLLGGRESRDRVFEATRTGEVVVLCNRFVLREGIDLPHLSHAIFATVFGELSTYLQSGGRVLRAFPGKKHATIQDHGGCLDTETEVLTARGWVGIDGISDTDSVAAFDRWNGGIRWCSILHRHERILEPGEKMFAVESRGLNIRVTGNHRILFNKRINAGASKVWPESFDFGRADELAASNWRFQVPVSGVQYTKGLPLTDDELRFIGWFLTDGCLERREGRKPTTVTFHQADHQPQIADLRACLKGCGFSWREGKAKGGFPGSKPQTRFSVPKGVSKSKPRTGWVRLEPYLDKNLTRQLDLLDERQFGVLLHAIHLGDGDKGKADGSYRIGTGNKAFADNLQSLAVRKGWKCNVSTDTSESRMNPLYVLNMQKAATATLHGSVAQTPDQQAKLIESPSIPGVTRVWCVANELETLVTRRRGMVAIIGNSWHRFGSLNADRHWFLDGTEAMYAGLRADALRAKVCPACGHPTAGNGKLCYFCKVPGVDQEPCRCPGCGAIHRQLIPGRKCSLCGFQFTGFVKSRPVFTVEGELVELAGDIFPPRKVQRRADTLDKWVGCYFRAKKASQTFSQADALFAIENYYHPPRDLPLMPKEPADWYRRVKDVPESELTATYAAVKAAKEGRRGEAEGDG